MQYFFVTVWFSENVHASVVIDAIGATNCGHFIATRQVEWIPCEQPVVTIGRMRIMQIYFQLTLVQIGHFTIEC